MRILLLTFLSAAVFYCGTFAQNKNDQDQFKSGYRGGFIKGFKTTDNALNFIVVGDWGRQGEYSQKEVAQQMGYAAIGIDADFIVSTGDNFYPDGVASTQDPLWQTSFENIYTSFPLQKKWYAVLGNHDYRSNPQAEVDYSKISHRWVMPSRYFSKKMMIDNDSNKQVLLVFIDTSPFVNKYYSDEVYGPNVSTQDSTAQLIWLSNILNNPSPSIKWKIVIGHHPVFTGGKRITSVDTKNVKDAIKPIFDKYNVDAYLCGHEHHLEYIKPAGATHYFISGAGSETRPVTVYPTIGKFAAEQAGFMTFSLTASKLLMQTINREGRIIYSTEIVKK